MVWYWPKWHGKKVPRFSFLYQCQLKKSAWCSNQINDQDVFWWTPSKNGICSSQSAYKANRKRLKPLSPKWNLTQEPSLLIISAGKIKTHASDSNLCMETYQSSGKLIRVHHNIHKISPNCDRCSRPKTCIHLFFRCPFAKAVWFESYLGFKTDTQMHDEFSCADYIYAIMSQPLINLWFISFFTCYDRFVKQEMIWNSRG